VLVFKKLVAILLLNGRAKGSSCRSAIDRSIRRTL
jgi:hypothetical protein